MTGYVGVYCRLSPRPDGSYEGVEAQEKWGRRYAARVWPGLPVEVFADAGISAANGDHRPEYQRLREWVTAGRLAHVWAVEQTRLERREVEWFQLAAELDAAGIGELHTDRDGIVRVRDEVAGIKAVLAAGEVRKLKRRVNDRLAEIAADGKPPGVRPFGYRHAVDPERGRTYEVVPEQADAIRWAVERVLTGWSLASIADDLDGRGLRGVHGGRITAQAVRSWLMAPSIAGHRVHRAEIVGRGNWPAIVDDSTWQAVKAKLSQPRRVKRSDGGTYPIGAAHTGNPTGRRYVLTGGLAVCGVCNAPMAGSMKQLRNASGVRTKPYLLCHRNKGGRGCVGIMLTETEAHVVDRLFAELDKPAFLDAVGADDSEQQRAELTAKLGVLDGRRTELATMWAGGELGAAEWSAARAALDEQEKALRAELVALPPPVATIDADQARSAWPDMTLDERRELVRMFVERVTIKRAKPGTKGFDPGRVHIEWRKR